MSLARLQLEFAAHLRDPDRVSAPPGIEPRRLAVYRELFLNNVASLLATTFPVCRAILGEAGWLLLVRRFYAGHKAHTPYFLELPREFVDWLGRDGTPAGELPPFIPELAHYEWVELALSIAEARMPAADPQGDLLAGRPVLSPLAWPLAYRWPVHRLGSGYQPSAAPATATFIVVHRDPDGAEVRFLEVDAATARLLELVEENADSTGAALVARVAHELAGGDPAAAVAQGEGMLAELRRRGILLGTAPEPGRETQPRLRGT